jgi:hypothetical protein
LTIDNRRWLWLAATALQPLRITLNQKERNWVATSFIKNRIVIKNRVEQKLSGGKAIAIDQRKLQDGTRDHTISLITAASASNGKEATSP